MHNAIKAGERLFFAIIAMGVIHILFKVSVSVVEKSFG